MLTEEYLETIRDRFFKAMNIDLKNLEPTEVHILLELLPEALIYLHKEYFMPEVYQDENVKYMIDKADGNV